MNEVNITYEEMILEEIHNIHHIHLFCSLNFLRTDGIKEIEYYIVTGI